MKSFVWNDEFEQQTKKKPHWQRMESSKHNNILSTQIRVYKPNIKKKPIHFEPSQKNTYNQQAKKIKPNKMYDLSHFISVLSIVRHLFRPNKYLPIFERSNYMMGTSYSTARRFWITKNLFILKNRMQYHVCISVIIIFNQTLRYFLTTRLGNVSTFNLYCNN